MIEGCSIDKNADILKISQLSFHKNQLDDISIHYDVKVFYTYIKFTIEQEEDYLTNTNNYYFFYYINK